MTDAPIADPEAEAELLGCLLLEPRFYGEAAELVTDADFYRGAHRTVWDAVVELISADRPVDVLAVGDLLEAQGRLDWVGGRLALADLIALPPSPTVFERDARRVAELARRRRALDAGRAVIAAATDPAVDLDEGLLDALDRLTATTEGRGGLITVGDVEDEVWRLRTEGRSVQSQPTGWKRLDEAWKLAPGRLTILTGWPSHGKSAFIDALAVEMAERHGWRTAFWSIEQAPVAEHVARLAGIAGKHSFDELPYDLLDHWVRFLDDDFVWVDHDVHTTVPAILAQFRVAHQRRRLNLAVIDPWTDVDLPRGRDVRADEAILDGLVRCFRFARSTGIHLIVVVHPKQRDRRADGTMPVPTNADLHGGSAYFKVCDFLLAVWRDDRASSPRPTTEVDIHVQKVRRNGLEGQMGWGAKLTFNPETGRYRARASASDPRPPGVGPWAQ